MWCTRRRYRYSSFGGIINVGFSAFLCFLYSPPPYSCSTDLFSHFISHAFIWKVGRGEWRWPVSMKTSILFIFETEFFILKMILNKICTLPMNLKCTKEYSSKTITHLVNHNHTQKPTYTHTCTAESFQSGCLFCYFFMSSLPILKCVCVHVSLTQSLFCTHA